MLKNIFLLFSIIFVLFGQSDACKGFKARLVKVENCAGPDAVITIDPETTVTLNEKCELLVQGCVTNKPFSTATGKYKLLKDGILIKEGTGDLCELANQADDETKSSLQLFGAPAACPVKAEKLCNTDKKIDLSTYKSMLSVVKGKLTLESDMEHDTGKSCIHLELEISK